MSGVSTGTMLAMAGMSTAGALVSALLQPDNSIPSPPKPDKPPQASQAPDVQGVRQNTQGMGQSGGAPGAAQTFLTGAGGIDPNSLQLGKTTLLGG